MADVPVAKTAFVGKRIPSKPEDDVPKTKDELLTNGYTLVEWDGM